MEKAVASKNEAALLVSSKKDKAVSVSSKNEGCGDG